MQMNFRGEEVDEDLMSVSLCERRGGREGGGISLTVDGARKRVGDGVERFRAEVSRSTRIIGGEGEAVLGGLSSLERSERSKRARFSAVRGVEMIRRERVEGEECVRDFDGVIEG